MSYSRFWTSKWYTYYSTSSDKETRSGQIFCIFAVKTFSYKELSENIDRCLSLVNGDDELRGYMEEFIKDVESDDTLK